MVLAFSVSSRAVGGLDRLLIANTACLSGSSKIVSKTKALAAPTCDQFSEWFEDMEGEAVSSFGLLRLLEGSYLLCM